MEVGAAGLMGSAGSAAAGLASGSLGYAARDWLSIELGGEWSATPWAMGFGGVRLTRAPARRPLGYGAFDLELGLGMGWGGRNCPPLAEPPAGTSFFHEWSEDCEVQSVGVAGGSYLGGGASYHRRWFSVFGRLRAQLTGVAGAPATMFASGVGGTQFRLWRTLDFYLAGGGVMLANREELGFGPIMEAGIIVHFGVTDRARTHLHRRAPSPPNTRGEVTRS